MTGRTALLSGPNAVGVRNALTPPENTTFCKTGLAACVPDTIFGDEMTNANFLPTALGWPVVPADEDGDNAGTSDGEGQVGVATKTRSKPKRPSQYKVLMLNDDYTPMEFVVMVLKRFFRMDLEQATRVMLHVHQRGVGVCGIFPYEVAETKVNQVMDFARENQHPLQCTLEKA